MAGRIKPLALKPGARLRVIAPSSPVEEDRLQRGCEELARLGFVPCWDRQAVLAQDGYFAGNAESRRRAWVEALVEEDSDAVLCARGGYGAAYLLEGEPLRLRKPKLLVGYSDITVLQAYLWRRFGWVTLYGPMVAGGFDAGAGVPAGYDREVFLKAATSTVGWSLGLDGETLRSGVAGGILLGGCLTLIEASLGTSWELDTRGAILVLEDRAMKPYQVDRALLHLKQAEKFRGLRGMIFGEFPECEAPKEGECVADVLRRMTRGLGVPVVWRAPVGHAVRPMLTVPLGVRARLMAQGAGRLEILEPACRQEMPAKAKGERPSRAR